MCRHNITQKRRRRASSCQCLTSSVSSITNAPDLLSLRAHYAVTKLYSATFTELKKKKLLRFMVERFSERNLWPARLCNFFFVKISLFTPYAQKWLGMVRFVASTLRYMPALRGKLFFAKNDDGFTLTINRLVHSMYVLTNVRQKKPFSIIQLYEILSSWCLRSKRLVCVITMLMLMFQSLSSCKSYVCCASTIRIFQ